MADVQGNDWDGDGGNQHEKSNKGRGAYVTLKAHWITKRTWRERSDLACRAGARLPDHEGASRVGDTQISVEKWKKWAQSG